MTSRRAVRTIWFRAARGAVEEGRATPLNAIRVVCAGCTPGDGPSCSGRWLIPPGSPTEFEPTDVIIRLGSGGYQDRSAVPTRAGAAATTPSPGGRLLDASRPRPAVSVAQHLRGASHVTHSFSTFASAPAPNSANGAGSIEAAAADAAGNGSAAAAAPAPTAEEAPAATGDAALLSLRAQLADSLALCLGMQQLDALLARPENRQAVDEMLLLSSLDVAYRLCASISSAPTSAPTSALAAAAAVKSSAEAASDVLTRLSELLIQRLSEPGALSAEGAVRALRTLAMLRFNPAGDYTGLQTMAAFYREAVLPQLDPDRPGLAPDLAARTPQLLADLFFAFSRLFDVAARREKELQSQLLAAQIAEEEEAVAREEASGGGGSGRDEAAVPPWGRTAGGYSGAGAAAAEGLMVLGDRQLYSQLCRMLSSPGMLANVPSKTLGTLTTAMATARFTHFPLAQSIATQTLLRLQGTGLAAAGPAGGVAAAAAAAGVRFADAPPVANDAMATSSLSNILSCLARLGYEHEALCDAVANWMLQRLQGCAAAAAAGGGGAVSPRTGGTGGVEPHHVVDVAVAFARIKYENMDFLLRASQVLQLKLPQANPQSVAMMTWAIANSKSGRAPEFEGVLAALAQRLVALHRYSTAAAAAGGGGGGGLAVLPRHLSCAVFALARLGHKHVRLMDATAADVMARADKYQARQLVNVLRAFTLLNEYVPQMYDTACAVLTSRLRALAGQSATALAVSPPAAEFVFAAPNYADAAWAVALAGHAPRAAELMSLLAERIAEVAPQLGKASVVRAAQAYAVAGSSEPRLMDALAQASRPLLVDLGPEYLAALVGAFAEGLHPVSEEFWLACMDAVGLKVPHLERPRPDMQLATWRLCDAFRRHPATQRFPACREHYVLQLLAALVDNQQQMLAQQ